MFRFYILAVCYTVLSYSIMIFAVFPVLANSQPPPLLQLANHYHQQIEVQNYWVSEKLDGVRAYWDGSQFISKKGHVYSAPEWFTEGFPRFPLDGELWIARNTFDELSGIVRKNKPIDKEWQKVSYQVFDLPQSPETFDRRLIKLKKVFNQEKIEFPEWLVLIKQYKSVSHDDLMAQLDLVVQQGGEGLMLHLGSSLYHGRRDDDLLKLKRYFDAEARVVEHIAGKGKNKGQLGSMLVEMLGGAQEKKRFRIGTGFSNEERKYPPPIGSIITYKYFGFTRNGLPRFASFMRIRKE